MAFKAAAAVLKTPICLPRRGGRGRGGGRGELWLAAAAGGQRRQQHRGDGRGADRLPLLRGHQPRGQTGPHRQLLHENIENSESHFRRPKVVIFTFCILHNLLCEQLKLPVIFSFLFTVTLFILFLF